MVMAGRSPFIVRIPFFVANLTAAVINLLFFFFFGSLYNLSPSDHVSHFLVVFSRSCIDWELIGNRRNLGHPRRYIKSVVARLPSPLPAFIGRICLTWRAESRRPPPCFPEMTPQAPYSPAALPDARSQVRPPSSSAMD